MPSAPSFYFDTYAMFERLRASPAYAAYDREPVVTHQMNAYELAAALLREQPESRARTAIALLAPNYLEAELDDLFAGARFRAEHSAKRVSYVDALGYVLAMKHGMRFLTGDKAFRGLENVEYVA